MNPENGRLPERQNNGSIANIKVIDKYNIQIKLRQANGRIWNGELLLKTRNYGELFFIYESDIEIEVGRRECFIRQIFIGVIRKDQLFFKPLTDLTAYGDELMTRETLTNTKLDEVED